jgi:hypothetical protein
VQGDVHDPTFLDLVLVADEDSDFSRAKSYQLPGAADRPGRVADSEDVGGAIGRSLTLGAD